MLPESTRNAIQCGMVPDLRDWRELPNDKLTRGERVCRFIEAYLLVPEGALVGRPIRLLPFQEAFILSVYDNPAGTTRAYLSIARKNSKTATIACLLLAHIVGPEAYPNGRIISGARSRKQAAEVYGYASKMFMMQPAFKKLGRCVPSSKTIIGYAKNVEYSAVSAEAATAHGGSPILAILDEVGQVKGPADAFVEAIETSQGAYEGKAMLFAISTQAATDNDLFSRWIDDANEAKTPTTVSHVYTAPDDCDLLDEEAWASANPALGVFRSRKDVAEFADRATRQPVDEVSFRWLFLNQRIDASAPFVSPGVWRACNAKPIDFGGRPVFAGLDLSAVSDLTALVAIAPREVEGKTIWDVKPEFWLPADGLRDKAHSDRVPYDVWHSQGMLNTTPGPTIEYEYIAEHLFRMKQEVNLQKIAFDDWAFRFLKPWLLKAGWEERELEGDDAIFVKMRQGLKTMTPALRDLESIILNRRLAHGDHPVLNMCMQNAVVKPDPQGNRILDKGKSRGRIDGAVALAMATSAGSTYEPPESLDDFISNLTFFKR